MKWNSPTFCELCQKRLIGVAEINSMIEADESVSVTVKQSKVIDWVFCKLCQSIVCKESCFDNQTGYCQSCSKDFASGEFSEKNPIGTINDRFSTDDILSSEIIF